MTAPPEVVVLVEALNNALDIAQARVALRGESPSDEEPIHTETKDGITVGMIRAARRALEGMQNDALDAERWRKLRPYWTAATFDASYYELGCKYETILHFVVPSGSSVSADADATVDDLPSQPTTSEAAVDAASDAEG